MRRLVLDRVVVRRGARTVGPISATLGPGVHGIAVARLDDLATLEGSLAEAHPPCEGLVRCEAEGPDAALVALADLLPLPPGHTLARLARLVANQHGDEALRRSGLDGDRLTHELASLEALAFALSLVAALPGAGALLVPSPHTLVSATLEREAARLLRSLAQAGFPVLVLLAPGLRAERFVDDVIDIDDAGLATSLASVNRHASGPRGLRVRGTDLDVLGQHLVRAGFSISLDDAGHELTLHAARLDEAERALTAALAGHSGSIEEVAPCP